MTVSRKNYLLIHFGVTLFFLMIVIVANRVEVLGVAGFFLGVLVCEIKHMRK